MFQKNLGDLVFKFVLLDPISRAEFANACNNIQSIPKQSCKPTQWLSPSALIKAIPILE